METDITQQQSRCPAELNKTGSIKERLAYFNSPDLVVNHPELDRVVARLIWATQSVGDQNVLLLIGPTGVGKTAALKLAVARMNAKIDSGEDPDPHAVPAMIIMAEPGEGRRFDYKHFYSSILAIIGEVAIERSLPLISRMAGLHTFVTVDPRPASWLSPSSALRMRVQNTLIKRSVLLLAIDEAVNLLIPSSSGSQNERRRQIVANAAVVRSLVNKSPTCLVLAGAYDFFDLTTQTGQLARRGDIVRFKEYEATPTGLYEFSIAWLGLVLHLPAKHDLEDPAYPAEMFVQCCGCIGLAKTILVKALRDALNNEVPVTQELVRQHYFSGPALARIRKEIEEGRAAFMDVDSGGGGIEVVAHPIQTDEEAAVVKAQPVRGARKRGVGEMNPRRSFTDNM